MPLFARQGKAVLFLHVPKTGGTAIEALFMNNGFRSEFLDTGAGGSFNRWRRVPPQHMEAKLVELMVRPGRCEYAFLTVRHPLQRLLSEYRMRRREQSDVPSLPEWFDRALKRLGEDPYFLENHLRPQNEFCMPTAEWFRYEDGLERVAKHVNGLPGLQLANQTIPNVRPDSDVPIPDEDILKVKPRVEQIYRDDYIRFGY